MNTLPNPLHGDWVDSMADWAVTHQQECGFCGGKCPTPQACEKPEPTENVSGLPLEPILNRHKWLGPTLVALVCFVWLCIDGYLENLP